MEPLRVVGKPIPQINAPEKVRGYAKYVGDMQLPRMLHAKLLRSPHPHARILGIRTDKALQVAGVAAVAISDDTPKVPGAWSRMTSRFSRLIRSVTSGRRLRPSPPRPRKPRWRRSSELRWNTRSCRPSSNWRRPSRPVRRKSMRERETCLGSSASVTATSNRGFQNPRRA